MAGDTKDRRAAALRPKNQVTVPRAIAQALGIRLGIASSLRFERASRTRFGYAACERATPGRWPAPIRSDEEAAEYLRAEREAWGE